eukprot:10538500-Prorocentrum_lima.AAC.1
MEGSGRRPRGWLASSVLEKDTDEESRIAWGIKHLSTRKPARSLEEPSILLRLKPRSGSA